MLKYFFWGLREKKNSCNKYRKYRTSEFGEIIQLHIFALTNPEIILLIDTR